MSFVFHCPACHAAHSGDELLIGRQVRCPKCGETITVPRPEPSVDEAAADGGEFELAEQPEVVDAEMDMTPMVDVTFLLLIFFMVTAAFALQKSIEIPKPQQDQASQQVQYKDPQTDPAYIIVRIDQNDTYQVLYESIAPEDAEAGSQQELLQKLRYARDSAPGGTPPSKLLVEAHGDAHHEYVVTALDAGTEVGMEQVQLLTVEEMD